MKTLKTLSLTAILLLSGSLMSNVTKVSAATPESMVSVTGYGVTGNDTSDDTSAIQKAIDAAASSGKTLDFPSGNYYINPNTGVSLRNNSSLNFESGAKLISEASSNGTYFIVKIWGVSNVKMTGYPTIVGDRKIHKGTGGESGMGIGIANSNNIYIENANISNCWGDGIYIGDNGLNQHYNKDVTIKNVVLDNNRRQGISVISAINLKIDNPKITNTNGTPPAAGIDFEPNFGYQYLQNITVTNPYIQGNDGHGIQFSIGLGPFDNPVSINIINASNVKNNEKHNYYGPSNTEYFLWLGSSGKVKGQIMIDGKNYWLVGSPTITNTTTTPSPSPTPTQPSQPATPTLSELQKQIDDLKAQNAALQSQVKNLSEEMNTLKNTITQIQNMFKQIASILLK
jgi:FtsZ-binding cell division protein ZapB